MRVHIHLAAHSPLSCCCPLGPGTTNRLDDFKSYIEARLGKPSHLLNGDRLRQFLEHNKRVSGFLCLISSLSQFSMVSAACLSPCQIQWLLVLPA